MRLTYKLHKKIIKLDEHNAEEIKAFIDVIMYMGMHVLPGTSDYWSSFPELRLDTVANIMPNKRVFTNLQCLYCNDNIKAVPQGAVGYNKLHKLCPLIDSLNVSFMNTYEPANVQSIDEKIV